MKKRFLFALFAFALVVQPVFAEDQADSIDNQFVADINTFLDSVFTEALNQLDPKQKDVSKLGAEVDGKSNLDDANAPFTIDAKAYIGFKNVVWSSKKVNPVKENVFALNVSAETKQGSEKDLTQIGGKVKLAVETDTLALFQFGAETFLDKWCTQEALVLVPKDKQQIADDTCDAMEEIEQAQNIEELGKILDGPLTELKELLDDEATSNPTLATLKYSFGVNGSGDTAELYIKAEWKAPKRDKKPSPLDSLLEAKGEIKVVAQSISFDLSGLFEEETKNVDKARASFVSDVKAALKNGDKDEAIEAIVDLGQDIKDVVVDGKVEAGIWMFPWFFFQDLN